MTVNTVDITSGPYTGNNTTDQYSYTFRITDKTQLEVFETTDLGVKTLLVVDTDYTVAGIDSDSGGIITRVAGNLPTDYTWFIRSNYPNTQATAFRSQGGFKPDVHEAAMDKLTFLIQQLNDAVDSSMRLSPEVDHTGISVILPEPVADGSFIWDPTGTFLIAGPSGTEISGAQASAIAAAASAAAALVSEGLADADAIATAADAAQTALDVIATAADVVSTNADVVTTTQDAIDTAADAVSTAADAAQTALDVIATGADVTSTNADAASTAADAISTAADAASTAADAISTAADAVSTAADVVASAATAYMDIAASVSGVPANSQTCLVFVAVRDIDLPASLTGSRAESLTAATASTDFDIKVNGVSKGTINFAISATVATFTFASEVNVLDGDVISIHGPASADATLADIGFNLKGSLP